MDSERLNRIRDVAKDVSKLASQHKSWVTIGTTYLPQGTVGRSDCTFALDANVLPSSETEFYVDAPQVGMTREAVVITAKMRSFANGSFQYAKMWVIPKSSIYSSGANGTYVRCAVIMDRDESVGICTESVQGTAFRPRGHRVVRTVVSQLQAQLARPR